MLDVVQKLKDKNQTSQQRKQAFGAVSIFYQIKINKNDQDITLVLNYKTENIATKKSVDVLMGFDN